MTLQRACSEESPTKPCRCTDQTHGVVHGCLARLLIAKGQRPLNVSMRLSRQVATAAHAASRAASAPGTAAGGAHPPPSGTLPPADDARAWPPLGAARPSQQGGQQTAESEASEARSRSSRGRAPADRAKPAPTVGASATGALPGGSLAVAGHVAMLVSRAFDEAGGQLNAGVFEQPGFDADFAEHCRAFVAARLRH